MKRKPKLTPKRENLWRGYALVGQVEAMGEPRPYRFSTMRSHLVMAACGVDRVEAVEIRVVKDTTARRLP